MIGSGPPRIPAWILARLLPRAARDEILGDLEENYRLRAESTGSGRARLWYWSQVLTIPFWIWGDRGETMISLSRHDLRYAIRSFRRAPGFTAVATCPWIFPFTGPSP